MKKFDVFIIGTGVAGTIIANKCAQNGLKTGIVDNRDYGGTCGLHGCVPKKILVGATEAVASSRNLEGKGISKAPSIKWKELIDFKNSFTDPIPKNKEKNFKKNGISTYHGNPKFVAENQLKIDDDIIEAKKIVIATGAIPRVLGIPGEEHALSSDDFLEMEKLPKSILFIGGGYIAFEFAHIAARSGAKVTILDMASTSLPHFDKEIVEHLVDATKELGIELVMNTKVAEIKKNGDSFIVVGDNDGKKNEFKSDTVFNTSGRVPAIHNLDLGKANVRYSDNGIEVSNFMQSISNSHVYAAGDNTATDGLPLTPFATMEGHIVAANILVGNKKKPDYGVRPTVVYTLPALAMVGMTEEQAQKKKLDITVNYASVPNWYAAKHLGEKTYAFKVIIDKKNDLILGAHIIGPNAEETINVFAVAMQAGMQAKDLKTIPFTFPSASSDIVKMV
ncbi:MAG: NAD(P)/FAD-dependent oxidoreductase [Dysgonamonadaceae bacterium]|jgi:glutathione reductase (NADPH)|nr:NAD(P)/FAD-dependent oxidoreductase [Dysgonamonadaceae bacterium]MDD3727949.1 NAD(P)/FAD-dependent oxidoreductase [Dysgonamonadaceae bacterium]MDD4605889.1 NAD(P)/FAD-dependent oxidoreductase [Dysgonamonadaceae bacterium]